MISIIIIFISFILEYLLYQLFSNTIFLPLIVITSLICIEPYIKNKTTFYIYCFITGFIYDLTYTGYYFMNAGLFLSIGYIVTIINKNTINNLITTPIKEIIMIILYHLQSFLFLALNNVIPLDINKLLKCIYSSFTINVTYSIILSTILYIISKKFNLKRID